MDNETREMFELISNKLDGIDSRQDEIFKVVKAIEHANQVHKAEIDSVKVMTDYHEGTFNHIGKITNSRKVVNQD